MRARALLSTITFSLLFLLLLVVQAPPIAGFTLAKDDGEDGASAMVVYAAASSLEASSVAALETWENFEPTAWVDATPISCTVEVYNQAGFTEEAEYQYGIGGAWTPWTAEGLQHTWLDATRRRVAVSGLPFPDSLTVNQNQIRFRYRASGGAWLESGSYSVRVDTLAPSSTVTIAPCYRSAMEITGTASDSASGVAAVQITLQRSSDGLYYNGSSWASTSRWITASGTTSWVFPFVPTVETTYLVRSRATDNVGHVQSAYGSGSFVYDVSPPASVVLTAGYFRTWPGTIQGSASDSGSGVSSVGITIQRASDRLYYNGASWGATPSWITATGTSLWTVFFTPAVETVYTVTSRATDNCGNLQPSPSASTFTYDATPPASAVATVGCFNLWGGSINGTANDAVSGVAAVRIALQRASDGFYYSGSSWGPTTAWITASGTTAWSLPFMPTVETVYTTSSQAIDQSGNVQSILGTGAFTYDFTQPHSSITTTGCVDSSFKAIEGAASDAVSGVADVRIKLQRASDGLYYNGAVWAPGVTWVNAIGTSSWSVPFTPTVQTLYTATASCMDHCGNVQGSLSVITFTHDLNPPSSTIATSGYYSGWIGSILGTAHDGESGVARVDVRLQRASDGKYYDGSSWTSSSQWIPASLTPAAAATGDSTAVPAFLARGTVSGAGGSISTLAVAGLDVNWALPFTPTVQTVYTIECRATDHCSNAQAVPGLTTFEYDAVAPLPPTNLAVEPSLWTPVNTFTVTWTNPPDSSGIEAVHYKWDSAPTGNEDESPGSPVFGHKIQSLPGIPVPVQGTHQLFLWLEDRTGNTSYLNSSPTGSTAFKWDATPPATSVITLTAAQGCAGWSVSPVQVSLQAVDAISPSVNATSGISATFWRRDGGDWLRVVTSTFEITDQGAHVVEYYSVDVAGNAEKSHPISPTIKIDTFPPTTYPPSFTGTLGQNGWYRSGVSVSLTAMDVTSGVSVTYHQLDGGTLEPGNSFSIVADGPHTIRYYSVDAACNQENAYTATLKIDKAAPNTEHQVDGRLGDNGWFVASPVTVTLSASDVITGVASSGIDTLFHRVDGGSWIASGIATSFPVAVPSGQKEYSRTVEYYATDLAGNAEPVYTLTVGMDFQAPPWPTFAPYVTPGGWTNVNCFDIRWYQNPADFSGIGGAYYSFQVPVSDTDGTLFLSDNLTSISCVQVPDTVGDGLRNVYVWLRDRAGNSDYRTRNSATVALDRIPPQVGLLVAGNSCGTAGWYNSCITVTAVATDTLSGMASGVISYQVNSGGWITGTSYSECQDGRHVIDGRARDTAGNTGDVTTRLVRVDRTAPETPTFAWVEPSGWSGNNPFTVHWVNPPDLSGLAGLYYKQGSPPSSSTDGIYVDGLQTSLVISATTEGSLPVYVWLVDKACNSDHQKAVTATLKYDHTPPTTTFSAVGTVGYNGWYTSPVSITLSCADSASGCGTSRYRIGEGPWQDGSSFVLDADGMLTFSYYSWDAAGNMEPVRAGTVKIDRTPPSSYAYSDGYSPSPSFTVRWDGSDPLSGIDTFDVQYRVGTCEDWQDWVSETTQKAGLFTGESGRVYYFRTRARDQAGNEKPYPVAADTYVSVDLLVNGDFERNLGGEWVTAFHPGPGEEEACPVTQAYVPSQTGSTTRVVVLGCPDQRTGAPFGESMICQTIDVPDACDMPAPVLRFRYNTHTYDVLWGPGQQRFFDSFNAGVSDPGQMSPTYVFTDGNRSLEYGNLIVLGWREGSLDLRPYEGQTIRACLANVTREDRYYNTWTFVDDVRIVHVEHAIALPIVQRVDFAQGSVAEESPKVTNPDLKGDR